MSFSNADLFLELPQLRMPLLFRDKLKPHVTKQQQQAMDLMSGVGVGSAPSTTFTTPSRESPWETTTVHPETTKGLSAWCRQTFNLKFSGVFFVRTKPNSIGPWHCDGPDINGRRCALNFMISGEPGKTTAQWGIHKHIDVDPEEIEKYFSGMVPETDVDIIGEHTSSLYVPFFYNTACLHRSFNQLSDQYRTLLSVCVADNIIVRQIKEMHSKGRLIREANNI
jgi:hypothetical protein